MKKIKIAMLSVVIILAIGGAYGGTNGFVKESWRTAVSNKEPKADPTRDLTPAEQKACDCTEFQQYYECGVYPEGGRVFCEAWQYGDDYQCITTVGVCTYYKPAPDSHPNFYSPCRNGYYWPTY